MNCIHQVFISNKKMSTTFMLLGMFVKLSFHSCLALTCGEVCTYDARFHHANCRNKGQMRVPSPQGCNNATILDLYGNLINRLLANDLVGYNLVEYLDFSSNLVEEIEPNAFKDTQHMIHIYLSHNHLSVLNETTFLGPQSLNHLQLGNNIIMGIHGKTFQTMQQLSVLHLGNNKLRNVLEDLFQFNVNLNSLHLNDNKLSKIYTNTFSTLRNLRVLDLSNNILDILLSDVFLGMKSLHTLKLAGNNLLSISIIRNYDGILGILDLRMNNISSAASITPYLYNIPELLLDYNPFHCDCEIDKLYKWLLNSSYSDSFNHVTCASPPGLAQTRIIDLPYITPCQSWSSSLPSKENEYITSELVTFTNTPRYHRTSVERRPSYLSTLYKQTVQNCIYYFAMYCDYLVYGFYFSNHNPLQKTRRI